MNISKLLGRKGNFAFSIILYLLQYLPVCALCTDVSSLSHIAFVIFLRYSYDICMLFSLSNIALV